MDAFLFLNIFGKWENIFLKDKNLKNTENEAQIIKKEDLDQHNSRGIYMRDDHCDWGSSGMSELIKALDDSN